MRGISALDVIAAPIDRLRQELQANNVPTGQEAQYFESKGRPIDPILVALIKMNQAERAGQPRQQQPMSSVLQDKIMAAMQQAQPRPLPPPAVMQQGQPQPQAQQSQPQQAQQGPQGGIAPLPFQNQGYARGGIVAFGDPELNPGEDQLVDGAMDDDEYSGEDTDYPASSNITQNLQVQQAQAQQDAADHAEAAKQVFKGPESQRLLEQALSYTPDKLRAQSQGLADLDAAEAQRKQDLLEKRYGKMSERQAKMYGIAEASFAALGQHNPWATARILGTGALKNTREVENLYRDAQDKKAEAAYNIKRATLLREAGLIKDANAMQQAGIKNAIAARRNEIAADRAAAAAGKPTGTWQAQSLQRIAQIKDKLETLDPASDDYKKLDRKLKQEQADLKSNARILNTQIEPAQIRAGSAERIADLNNRTKLNLGELTAKAKQSAAGAKAAVDAINAEIKLYQAELPYAVLTGQLAPQSPEQQRAMTRFNELHDALKGIQGKPQLPGGGAAPDAANTRPPLSSFQPK